MSLWDQYRPGFTLLFFSTYFAQNSFFSFFNFLNSVYLRTTDVSYTKIGLFSLISLSNNNNNDVIGVEIEFFFSI